MKTIPEQIVTLKELATEKYPYVNWQGLPDSVFKKFLEPDEVYRLDILDRLYDYVVSQGLTEVVE